MDKLPALGERSGKEDGASVPEIPPRPLRPLRPRGRRGGPGRRLGPLLVAALFAGEAVGLSADLSPAGIATVNGGFGEEELAEMAHLAPTYGLELTFAAPGGAYVAAVALRILDSGGEVLVEIPQAGPKVLAGLPPGIYRISAIQGQTQVQRTLTLESGRPQRLTLFFPLREPVAPPE